MEEYTYASACTIADAIRTKQVSSEEVIRAQIARIEAVNPLINAVVQLRAEEAVIEARRADEAMAHGRLLGPLHGVPITVKDLLETKEVITTAGTFGRVAYVPKEDATAVARLRTAGAILLGKTNTPELAVMPETDNGVYGLTRNPFDLTKSTFGSSGGEAAIIAAGGSPLGLGSDLGGSIRMPAHACGIAGLKPTSGRVPMTGHFPPSDGALRPLWTIGPMARYVEDLALVLPLISGADWRDPTALSAPVGDMRSIDLRSLRVAYFLSTNVAAPTPETSETVKSVAEMLSQLCIAVEEVSPKGIEHASDIWVSLFAGDGGAGLRELLRKAGTRKPHSLLETGLKTLRRCRMTTEEFYALLVRLDEFRDDMLFFMKDFDAILCPVVACPALPHGFSLEGRTHGAFGYSMIFSLTGWPSAVVRAGTSPEGLPIGVQVASSPWREHVALAVALQIERVFGGWKPPRI